jgi:spore coat-associated protein N
MQRRRALLGAVVGSAALGIGTIAAIVAGSGQGFSLWTSTATLSQQVQLGTVQISLTGSGPTSSQLSGELEPWAPGDTAFALASLTNTGHVPLSQVDMHVTVTSASPSPLVTSTSGLQMSIYDCSVAWNGTSNLNAYGQTVMGYVVPGGSPLTSSSCFGVVSQVLAPTPVAQLDGYASSTTSPTPVTAVLESSAGSDTEGSVCIGLAVCDGLTTATFTDHLLFVFSLPSSTTISDPSTIVSPDTLSIAITGVQETGTIL